MLGLAKSRAKAADVRGLERLLDQIHARDAAMGGKRPETVSSLLDAVATELDAARRLQLARDSWTLRAPVLQKYRASILESLNRFAQLDGRAREHQGARRLEPLRSLEHRAIGRGHAEKYRRRHAARRALWRARRSL